MRQKINIQEIARERGRLNRKRAQCLQQMLIHSQCSLTYLCVFPVHHDVVVMLTSTPRQSMDSHGSTSSPSEQAPPNEPNAVRLIYLVIVAY